jgi:hypothetical protein
MVCAAGNARPADDLDRLGIGQHPRLGRQDAGGMTRRAEERLAQELAGFGHRDERDRVQAALGGEVLGLGQRLARRDHHQRVVALDHPVIDQIVQT